MLSKQKSGSIRGNISISDFMRVSDLRFVTRLNAVFLLYVKLEMFALKELALFWLITENVSDILYLHLFVHSA